MLQLIDNINNEIVENDQRIDKEESQNKEMEKKILEAEAKKEQLKEEVDNLFIAHRKEKDEPESLEKSNVNLKKSVAKV